MREVGFHHLHGPPFAGIFTLIYLALMRKKVDKPQENVTY